MIHVSYDKMNSFVSFVTSHLKKKHYNSYSSVVPVVRRCKTK